MDPWTTKRILILGTTYPAYSTKYIENACTGGIEEDTGRMVRVHPVPLRYLEPGSRFQKFQWITAKVQKHSSDPRPESLRVEPESIVVGDVISSKEHEERRRLIEASPHFMKSVEELKDRWDAERTSLGTICPKEVLGVKVVEKPAAERAEWKQKEDELFAQERFEFDRPPKKLDFPDLDFLVSWVCDDDRCPGHEMKILQWGLHELARKYQGDPARIAKVEQKMKQELDLDRRDVFLFLGNYRARTFQFGLMDSFSPSKKYQLSLF